jgi:hypothetical protein
MRNQITIALALIAGLFGGLFARYLAPPAAFAQDQSLATKEIRAQSFSLVDPADRTVGTFTVEPLRGGAGPEIILRSPQAPGNQFAPQRPVPMRIVLRDGNGRELWSAGGTVIHPLSDR